MSHNNIQCNELLGTKVPSKREFKGTLRHECANEEMSRLKFLTRICQRLEMYEELGITNSPPITSPDRFFCE